GVALTAAWPPVAALIGIVTVAVLVFAAWHVRTIRLGVDVISGLPPTSQSQMAAHAATSGFAPGVLAPADVIVQGRSGRPLPRPALMRLEQELRREPGFAAVVGPTEQPPEAPVRPFLAMDGRAARYVLVSDSDPLGPDGVSGLKHLEDAMPGLLHDAGLGGASARFAG